MLTNNSEKASILNFNSYKSKRVLRSVLGGETLAFSDAFDAAYSIRHDLQRILRREIPLAMLTDSMSLFKVIINSSTMTEKRLMIDLNAARDAYKTSDIGHIGWLRSGSNLANGLTKLGICEVLDRFIRSNTLDQHAMKVCNGRLDLIPLSWEAFLSSKKDRGGVSS